MTKALQTKDTGISFEIWKGNRQKFIEEVRSIMVEGVDFHRLNLRGREVRSLAKGGAEKVSSAFGWVASFSKDQDTVDMLGSIPGMVAYVCRLEDKSGKFIGEGRGARRLSQDQNDVNKTIKMAQKSAYIDAILRTSGLSDIFTQDVEDMKGMEYDDSPIPEDAEPIVVGDVEPEIETTSIVESKKEINELLKSMGRYVRNKAEAEKVILELTGLDLREDNYSRIIKVLHGKLPH